MARHYRPAPTSRRTTYILYSSITILTTIILFSRFRLSTDSNDSAAFNSQANAVSFKKESSTSANENDVATSNSETKLRPSLNSGLDAEDGRTPFSSPSGLGDGGFWSNSNQDENYNPFTSNSIPISEITVITCILPPSLAHICSPKTTLKETMLRGKWVRVERDLNRRVGVYYLYFFYRRLLPNSRLGVVTNATILTHSPTSDDLKSSGSSIWVEVSQSLTAGVWPKKGSMFFHFLLTPQHEVNEARSKHNGNAGDLEPFTEMDIVYGGSPAPYGFELMKQKITGGEDDENREMNGKDKKGTRHGVSIAIRKQVKALPPKKTLTFSEKGKFRILQVADLHLSTTVGACRDMAEGLLKTECEKVGGDEYSLKWFKKSLEASQPALVVLTGDQLNGQDTSFSPYSTILKFAPILAEMKIPFAAIFGNHDAEVGESREEQMIMMEKTLPYFLGSAGPPSVDGIGNYQLEIHSPSPQNETLFNLYFLDSHANEKKSTFSFFSFKQAGYDFLKPSQINWFRTQSSAVKPLMRPYSLKPTSTPYDDKKKRADFDETDDEAEFGIGSTMIPDDGSRIMDYGDSAELDSYEAEMEEALEGIKPIKKVPFVSEIGPTKAKPLLAKPNAIMFFHIPLREAYDSPIDLDSNKKQIVTGHRYEGEGASKTNGGFWEQAIMAQREIVVNSTSGTPKLDSFWDGEFNSITKGRTEVKVIANGHCHLSQDCRQVQGVYMCFAGGASYSGYGKPEIKREMRIFDLSAFGEIITTSRLVDNGPDLKAEILDELILSGEGERK